MIVIIQKMLTVLWISQVVAFLPVVNGFVAPKFANPRSPRLQGCPLASKNPEAENDEDDPIFYNDFDQVSPEDSVSFFTPANTDNLSSLTERVQQVQATDRAEAARIRTNWAEANWEVRGFSLDAIDCKADGSAPLIHITTLTPSTDPDDESEQLVWVGRSDGSLVLVQLGSDYLTHFSSTLTLEPTTGNSVSVKSKLVRDDGNNPWIEANDSFRQDPFGILCQAQPYQGQPISHLVTALHKIVYTVAQGDPQILPWLIPETTTADEEGFRLVAQPALPNVHPASVVGLHTVSLTNDESAPTLLASVSEDGTLALWDISSGDLLFTCNIDATEDDYAAESLAVTSATASHGYWFLGLANGKILAYQLDQLLEATADGSPCPLPACEWQANPQKAAVTAIHCMGNTTLRGLSPSLVVISGDSQGMVQQWNLLERQARVEGSSDTKTVLDAWPKMANQRVPGRAHLFQGHEDTITSITSTKNTDFVVTASRDGTVRAWHPATGKVATRMDGFEEIIPCQLCLVGHDLLLTGSGHYVTVHDFSTTDDDLVEQIDPLD